MNKNVQSEGRTLASTNWDGLHLEVWTFYVHVQIRDVEYRSMYTFSFESLNISPVWFWD